MGGASTGVDFGAGPITSAGDQDGFIARFGADGTLRWSNTFGGPTWDIAYAIAADVEELVFGDFIGRDATNVDFDGGRSNRRSGLGGRRGGIGFRMS